MQLINCIDQCDELSTRLICTPIPVCSEELEIISNKPNTTSTVTIKCLSLGGITIYKQTEVSFDGNGVGKVSIEPGTTLFYSTREPVVYQIEVDDAKLFADGHCVDAIKFTTSQCY